MNYEKKLKSYHINSWENGLEFHPSQISPISKIVTIICWRKKRFEAFERVSHSSWGTGSGWPAKRNIQRSFQWKTLLHSTIMRNVQGKQSSLQNMAADHNAYSPGSRTPSTFHQRSHSRSASWSYTSGNGQITLAPLNPIRSVIREFVPSFGHRSPGSRSSASSPLSPLSPSSYVNIAEVLRDANDEEDTGTNRMSNFTAVNVNSGNSSEADAEHGDANMAPGNPNSSGNGSGRAAGDRVEFQGTISWLEKSLPFVILLLSRIMWDHRLGWWSRLCFTPLH